MDNLICCGPIETRDDGESLVDGESDLDHDGKLLECDYDATCTKLYKMIENKKWEEIAHFLETGKWYYDTSFITSVIFGAGPDPRFIESRTWVTALDEMGNVRWCQLPLHAAITFQAPFDLITKLIEIYPESIRCADDQDMLPLHYAFRFGSEDNVLAHLLEEFPHAIKKEALRGRLPLDMAHYSSRPERGIIIDAYVDSAIDEARGDWDDENRHALSKMKLSTKGDEASTKSEKLRNEIYEARKKIKELEEKLRDNREMPPSGRNSAHRNRAPRRPSKERREELSAGISEEMTVDRRSTKSFGKKMLEKAKKQLVA